MRDPAVLLCDGYKLGHVSQYPPGTQYVYSNLTARAPRVPGGDGVIFFGLQYFLLRYLGDEFGEFFRGRKDAQISRFRNRVDSYLGEGAVPTRHIEELHEIGYLPLCIKALPEGTLVPYGVPMLTIENTDPRFFWLTNSIETLLSSVVWKACTSATSALQFRRTFEKYAKETGASKEFIPWQGHDFSFRGMSGPEDAALSGAAHLLCFTGTDTVPAIDLIEEYYDPGFDDSVIIGGSVPATEHSVMCAGGFEDERETFRRLICDVYPKGVVSIVSDTWDFWSVLTNIVPSLKAEILARDGKVVIRPDSGNPSLIINGDPSYGPADADAPPQAKGALRLLDETFGSTKNALGFKTLDPRVGLIYGDNITHDRQHQILHEMMLNGFASDNIVLGIGSYNYQYTTRDVHGFAMKATNVKHATRGEVPIYKAPKTDSAGVKKSAKGLLRVDRINGVLTLKENVTREEERGGELIMQYMNGYTLSAYPIADIRNRVALAWRAPQ